MPSTLHALLAAGGLLLAGCAAVSPPQAPQSSVQQAAANAPKAIVHFHGETDPEVAWMSKSKTMQWGLMFTPDDLVVVKENRPAGQRSTLINSPRYFEKEFLNRMATVKGIPNGERKTLELEPGAYDWLVLIDIEGDGLVDGYLATEAVQAPLSSFEFLPGKEYFIEVDKQGQLSFRVEPAQPFYLALMDSLAERLPEADDALLKDYVELVVDEIDALRKMKGDLCYDLLEGNGREGLAVAYDALPQALKIRESAIIQRVLRITRVDRPTYDETQADEALAPIARELEKVYGDGMDVLDDEALFAENKDLGCSIHRDMLALTLLMPVEEAAPLWRYMFADDDEDDDDDDEPMGSGPVTNV